METNDEKELQSKINRLNDAVKIIKAQHAREAKPNPDPENSEPQNSNRIRSCYRCEWAFNCFEHNYEGRNGGCSRYVYVD